MASRRPLLRSTTLVLAGVAGVVLAHGLDYLLVIPSTRERARELAATGHAWWSSAPAAAVAAGCVAVALAAAGGGMRAVFAARPARGGRGDVLPVALGQVTVFTVLELSERLGAHRSPLELLHGPLFLTGVVLQVAVAWAAVALLRLVERAGATVAAEALGGGGRRRRRRPRLVAVPLALGAGGAPAGRPEARGPPAAAA